MSKGMKIVLSVLGIYVVISFLHVWLNIGFEKIGLAHTERAQSTFKVGFLPVT